MQDLPRRVLGRTGLSVTALGFGALELRGMIAGVGRPLADGQPETILNAVLGAGINYLDVAVDYGEAETHIGRCVSNRRQEFILATKCGCPLDVANFSPDERTRFGVPLPRLHDYNRENILNACDQSLRRMRTDYLDIVQFHFSPAREALEQEGAVQTLQDLKQQGKIRFLGCSSILPNIWDHIEMDVFDVLQVPYSILQPEHEEAIAAAAAAGLGIVIRGGVARGSPVRVREWPKSGTCGRKPVSTSCCRICRPRNSCYAPPSPTRTHTRPSSAPSSRRTSEKTSPPS